MSPMPERACRIYTNDGDIALTGDDRTQTMLFDRTQYAYVPPVVPRFMVQDESIPELTPAITLNARTEISGNIINSAVNFDDIRNRIETQAIQNIQHQYFRLLNPGSTSVTVTDNWWGATSAGTTASFANDPWRIQTSGTNYIQIPNGVRLIQIVNEPTTGSNYQVTVTAEIDPFAWEIIQKQQKDYAPTKIREHMRSRLVIKVSKKVPSRIPLTHEQRVSAQELKARDTLRDMITEWEWRRYVTNGFIMVKGKSGIWYQVFGNGDRLKTYKDGKPFESLCIHTDRECPPSDHVINMKVMIEIDEEAVRKGSNITPLRCVGNGTPEGDAAAQRLQAETDALMKQRNQPPQEERLVDIYKRLKPAKTA